MESKLNNCDVLKHGDFNENQIFFIQRWLELLNIHTHSKYAVRYLNTHEALREVLYVCKGMIEGDIKRSDPHLKLVFDEVNKIINSDKLFEKYAESHCKIMRNTLRASPRTKETAKLYSIVYQLEYVIRHLSPNYLNWVVRELKSALLINDTSSNNLEKIESLLCVLASELIGKGWSLEALHSLVKQTMLNDTATVQERFDHLFAMMTSEQEDYTYLFSVKSGLTRETRANLLRFEMDLINGQGVLNTYPEYNLVQNVAKEKWYLRIHGQAFDKQTGINTAWQKIAEQMDVLNFYGFPIPNLATAPIVLHQDRAEYTRNIQVSLLTRKKKFQAPKTIMDKIKQQLDKGNNEVNRKIRSMFEFSRISDESLSPQSAYLNLWIGIESFVQTKEYDGGIENVKVVVAASSTHNYLYSLLKNFIEDCSRCNLEVTLQNEVIKLGRQTPQEAIKILLDDENVRLIETECRELNYLLAYRYKEIVRVLQDGKESSKLLRNHHGNITQHIQRLYRLRNSIVHSGEVHYNINLFIKHLHEYMESVMSVVLHRLEEAPEAKLEEIFAQVRDGVEATSDALSNSKHLDKDAYYELVLKGAF